MGEDDHGDDSTSSNGRPRPAKAFRALADERRIAILRALYEAQRSAAKPAERRLSFSALYDRVDVDGTSTFSYHLDELKGTYVDSGAGGYQLTATGRRVVQAVLGGAYTELPTFDGLTVEATCPECERSPVEAACNDGVLAVFCPDCSLPLVQNLVQPAQLVGRTPEEVVADHDRKLRHDMALELDGICAVCAGPVSVSVHRSERQPELSWLAAVECQQCGKQSRLPPYFALLVHPVVISFYLEHGVDLRNVPTWQAIEFVIDGEWTPTPTDTDPFECRIDIDQDGDRLAVTLDERLRVSEATVRKREFPLPADEDER